MFGQFYINHAPNYARNIRGVFRKIMDSKKSPIFFFAACCSLDIVRWYTALNRLSVACPIRSQACLTDIAFIAATFAGEKEMAEIDRQVFNAVSVTLLALAFCFVLAISINLWYNYFV